MASTATKNKTTKANAARRLRPGVLPPDKEYFRVDEAADVLETSTRSIYRMIEHGELTRVKRRGKRVIPRSELERILNVDAYYEED